MGPGQNEVNMLENEKWKSTNQILTLNRMIDEFGGSLAHKRGEMAYMNQETGWYDNTDNLYPIPYSEPEIRERLDPSNFLLSAVQAALVCISRVYVGGHYPLDVVGGILLGVGVSFIFVGLQYSDYVRSEQFRDYFATF